MVDLILSDHKTFIPASQFKDLTLYDTVPSQNNTPLPCEDPHSHSPEPWDLWQPFELTDNYSEASDETIGMGWTARYAKKGPEDVFSDFTEDFTDEEEYETSCSRLIISHAAPLPDSETFVPEFGLNYPQFYLDFPSQHLSQTSEFHIDEQTSFLDPLSEREGSDSDFDNWEVFDVGPLPAHAAQTQPKGNAGSDHNQLPK